MLSECRVCWLTAQPSFTLAGTPGMGLQGAGRRVLIKSYRLPRMQKSSKLSAALLIR